MVQVKLKLLLQGTSIDGYSGERKSLSVYMYDLIGGYMAWLYTKWFFFLRSFEGYEKKAQVKV